MPENRIQGLRPVEQAAETTQGQLQHQNALASEQNNARLQLAALKTKRAIKEGQQQLNTQKLAQRDRDVRAHEQAHVAVGGTYVGAARYQYVQGPNGVNYAIAGEVSISTTPAATPEAQLQQAQSLRRSALAPADPSPQDILVAADAMRLERQALHALREKASAGTPGADKQPDASGQASKLELYKANAGEATRAEASTPSWVAQA